MTIKHIVLSGGGPSGFVAYGALKELHKRGFWDLGEINSIYGTSIGALIGLVVSLDIEWHILDNYLIKRPWKKLLSITPEKVVNCMQNKGMFGVEVAEAVLTPLLEAKGLTCETTLKDLYEKNSIDFVAFATNLNTDRLESVALSHKTFPDLKIVTAIAMSIAIPMIFQPVFYNGGCYIDGAALTNLPVDECIRDQKCNINELLVVNILWDDDNDSTIDPITSFSKYVGILTRKAQLALRNEQMYTHLPYCIESRMVLYSVMNPWIDVVFDESLREQFVEQGLIDATKFYKSLDGNIEKLV